MVYARGGWPYDVAVIRAWRRAAVVVAVLLLPLAGCSGHGGSGKAATGVVHGKVVGVGGPAGAADVSLPATVAAFQAGREITRQAVLQGAEFSFTLAPGAYQLAVTDENNTCQPVAVQVASGSNQTADITCQIK